MKAGQTVKLVANLIEDAKVKGVYYPANVCQSVELGKTYVVRDVLENGKMIRLVGIPYCFSPASFVDHLSNPAYDALKINPNSVYVVTRTLGKAVGQLVYNGKRGTVTFEPVARKNFSFVMPVHEFVEGINNGDIKLRKVEDNA